MAVRPQSPAASGLRRSRRRRQPRRLSASLIAAAAAALLVVASTRRDGDGAGAGAGAPLMMTAHAFSTGRCSVVTSPARSAAALMAPSSSSALGMGAREDEIRRKVSPFWRLYERGCV